LRNKTAFAVIETMFELERGRVRDSIEIEAWKAKFYGCQTYKDSLEAFKNTCMETSTILYDKNAKLHKEKDWLKRYLFGSISLNALLVIILLL
jgi:hypothetical protein